MKFNPINPIKTLYYRQFNRIDPRPGKMTLSKAFGLKLKNVTISPKTEEKLKEVFKNSLFSTSACVANVHSISNMRKQLFKVDAMLDTMRASEGRNALSALANSMRSSFNDACKATDQCLPGQGSSNGSTSVTALSSVAIPVTANADDPTYATRAMYADPTHHTFTLTHAIDLFEDAHGGEADNADWLSQFAKLRYGLDCGTVSPQEPAELLRLRHSKGHRSLKVAAEELSEFRKERLRCDNVPCSLAVVSWLKAFDRDIHELTTRWMDVHEASRRTHAEEWTALAASWLGFDDRAMASDNMSADETGDEDGYASSTGAHTDDWEAWSSASAFSAASCEGQDMPPVSEHIYANVQASHVRSLAKMFDTQGFTAPQPIRR